LTKSDEFIFSGIINHTELTENQRRQISLWINQLVFGLSLKGLNSLDFIQNEENSYVLEINHRPPASMQLYGEDLLSLHINACYGELPESIPQHDLVSGMQVVYARRNLRIPEGFDWPEGSQDLPAAGSIIGAGQPICSIINRGMGPSTVHEKLRFYQSLINQQLKQDSDLWNTARA
jgi:predicted ATP-grasp superfamily ATP-dependent carboligase